MKTLIALLMLTTVAVAEDKKIDFGSLKPDYTYPLVVTAAPAKETFRMEEGACLRGPLTFFDMEGKEIFKLPAKIDYPDGCTSK